MNAPSYKQLVTEHDAIEHAADDVLRATLNQPIDRDTVSDKLGALATIVADHLAHEDVLLYPKLDKVAGGRVSDQLDVLREDWIVYLRDWTPECVAADSDTFIRETEKIIARLKSHVRMESDLLYATALQEGRIHLR
jgi:iron-sulfur cluster repair protein YtfE (RIC family)